MFSCEIYWSTMGQWKRKEHIWERELRQAERERERDYKGEMNGNVNGSVYTGIAVDAQVKNRNVSAAMDSDWLKESQAEELLKYVQDRKEKKDWLGTRHNDVKMAKNYGAYFGWTSWRDLTPATKLWTS